MNDQGLSRTELERVFRERYPRAFDGSDPVENMVGLNPRHVADWVIAYEFLKHLEAAERSSGQREAK